MFSMAEEMTVLLRSGVAFIAFGGGGCLCIQHTCSLRKYPTFFPSPPLFYDPLNDPRPSLTMHR